MNTIQIGPFYQGQPITIKMAAAENATDEQKEMLVKNHVYVGIYEVNLNKVKPFVVLSTEDNTLHRIAAPEEPIVIEGTLTPMQTKTMRGRYKMELLIKSEDNTFCNPSENVIEFEVETRFLSSVIQEKQADNETESNA